MMEVRSVQYKTYSQKRVKLYVDGINELYVDQCDTSTQCYPYRQSNTTSAHSWDNLTCNMDTCLLINIDGSQPAAPIPLDNTTIVLPTTNSSDTHHPTNKDTNRHHNSPFDLKSGSAISIALTSVCIIVSLCLVAWLIRILFYKTTYWPVINKFLCCGRCAYKSSDGSSNRSSTSTTRSPPPSFHSTGLVMRSNSNNSSHGSVLPNYFQQDPSPPKYEHAIVTQIRGMRFLNHSSLDNDNNENSASEHQPIWVPAQQPVWMPVYISPPRQNPSNSNSFAAFISGNNSQDWATETIRHQPSPSTEEEEETDLVDSHRR
ncbi:unnamed protein product [Mucor hiemalis]